MSGRGPRDLAQQVEGRRAVRELLVANTRKVHDLWLASDAAASPILDEINAEHGDKVTFLKMNVDENPVTPSSYRVTGIPTINVYKDGEVVKSIVGAKPKAALLKELADFI